MSFCASGVVLVHVQLSQKAAEVYFILRTSEKSWMLRFECGINICSCSFWRVSDHWSAVQYWVCACYILAELTFSVSLLLVISNIYIDDKHRNSLGHKARKHDKAKVIPISSCFYFNLKLFWNLKYIKLKNFNYTILVYCITHIYIIHTNVQRFRVRIF